MSEQYVWVILKCLYSQSTLHEKPEINVNVLVWHLVYTFVIPVFFFILLAIVPA